MSSINVANLFSVTGLVAVITGGASALEENGAKVYIIDRRPEALEKAIKQAHHGNIISIQGDVTSKEDLSNAVAQITKEEGFINLLCANAGITGPTYESPVPNPTLAQLQETLWTTDSQAFTNTSNVNVTGMFFSVLAFLPLLEAGNAKGNLEQKSQVIGTSSIAGFSRDAMAGFAYNASKAGTTLLMKQFSTLLTPYGIRSNVIAPGVYPTERTEEFLAKADSEDAVKAIPMQRFGTAEDMAGAVLFLASKAGAYLSGNVIITDGGWLGGVPSTY